MTLNRNRNEFKRNVLYVKDTQFSMYINGIHKGYVHKINSVWQILYIISLDLFLFLSFALRFSLSHSHRLLTFELHKINLLCEWTEQIVHNVLKPVYNVLILLMTTISREFVYMHKIGSATRHTHTHNSISIRPYGSNE